MTRRTTIWITLAFAVLAALLALGLRLRAAQLIPIDYDEDDYLAAGQRYALALRSGDMETLVNYDYNNEHPPLTKIIYALSIISLPDAPLLPELSSTLPPSESLPRPHFEFARRSSVIISTLQTLVLALVNPLAGFFMAIHTYHIKYTSQIMLEPFPSLTSLLVVVFYVLSRRIKPGWLVLSAFSLGLTAASKYTYCLVGVAVVIDWLWNSIHSVEDKPTLNLRSSLPLILAWGGLSILVFVAFDPRLWSNPLERLWQSLVFHGHYAQSAHVRQAGFPFWQPFIWLTQPVEWHPGVFLVSLDLFIAIFAAAGLRRLWNDSRVYAIWLVITLLFLLAWTTKWPQYILTLTAPLCLSAACGVRELLWEPLVRWRKGQRHPPPARPESWKALKKALPWMIPGLIALFAVTFYPLIFQAGMALTDFSNTSILDGLRGGVWREVIGGLTGQIHAFKPGTDETFTFGKQVRFVGTLIFSRLSPGGLLFFEVMWTFLAVLTQAALGIFLAVILYQPGISGKKVWRTLFILPWAVPEFVGALMWSQIYDPNYGWSQAIAEAAKHPEFAIGSWQQNPDLSLVLLLLAALWYGFPILFLGATAGLKTIQREVWDAAALDGASGLRLFRDVTFPLLLPALFPVILLRSIQSFNQFYLFFVLRPAFPVITLSTISYYVFNEGQFSVSAAINLVTLAILIFLLIFINRWRRDES